MAAKKNPIKSSARQKAQRPGWKNMILALSLVPLVAGILFIVAWALDWDLIGFLENQVYVGILFILFSFAIANLVQQRWLLFAGWLLLMLADLLFLFWVNPSAQLVAAGLGIVGTGMIGFRYFQQIAQQAPQEK